MIADPIGPGQAPPVQLRSAVQDIHGTVPHVSEQQADHDGLAIARTPRNEHIIVTTCPVLMSTSFWRWPPQPRNRFAPYQGSPVSVKDTSSAERLSPNLPVNNG